MRSILVFVLLSGLLRGQTTSITATDCGFQYPNWTRLIHADAVTGATNYEFRLRHPVFGTTVTVVKSNNNCNLSQLVPIVANTAYTIDVQPYVGGVWQGYGPFCTIATPQKYPLAEVDPNYGGYVITSFNEVIPLIPPGVDPTVGDYYSIQFLHTSPSYNWAVTNVNPNFALYQWNSQPLQYNTTYSVFAAYRWQGNTGPYSTVCIMNTPATATTVIDPLYCGTTISTNTTLVKAIEITGSTGYEFQMVNTALSFTASTQNVNDNFTLSQISGLQPNTAYDCSVRVFHYGGWRPYGASCVIITP